jgi:hypothetical protein
MEYLIYWLFEFIGCSLARFAIPAPWSGRAYVHPPITPAEHFNWLGWRRDEDGRMLVARDVAGFIGFMIVIVFLVVVLAVRPF